MSYIIGLFLFKMRQTPVYMLIEKITACACVDVSPERARKIVNVRN